MRIQDFHDDDPSLPRDVVEGLSRAYREGPVIPRGVDEAMMSAARVRLRRPVLARVGVRRLVVPAAAAALVLLFVWYAAPLIGPARQGPPSMQGWRIPGIAGEVALEGDVDILSALRMAKAIQFGPGRAEWDLNGDGRVDLADVDALALRAVSLGGAS